MQTKPKTISVHLRNNSLSEVTYFCTDEKANVKEKRKGFIYLVCQICECDIYTQIPIDISNDPAKIEHMVNKVVINNRDHLC